MSASGQSQTVSREILEKKVGRSLSLGDTFTTKTGMWKIVDVNVAKNNTDLLIVEKML